MSHHSSLQDFLAADQAPRTKSAKAKKVEYAHGLKEDPNPEHILSSKPKHQAVPVARLVSRLRRTLLSGRHHGRRFHAGPQTHGLRFQIWGQDWCSPRCFQSFRALVTAGLSSSRSCRLRRQPEDPPCRKRRKRVHLVPGSAWLGTETGGVQKLTP